MLGLKEQCLHPTSQKPYIKSFSGGKNNSPEGHSVCNAPGSLTPTNLYSLKICYCIYVADPLEMLDTTVTSLLL